MVETIRTFLASSITGAFSSQIITLVLLLGIFLVAVLAYFVTKLLLTALEKAILRSPTDWDDDLLNPRFMRAVSQLAPALIVSWLLPQFFADTPQSVRWIDMLTSFYILWAIVRIIVIFIGNLYDAFLKRDNLRPYAVKGIFQMFKLIVIGVGVIIAISLLINKTPIAILTALGASAAVLSLVFKDTILGLVASVQLTANNMLSRGDWITVPKHDLNGEVLDVSLTTVKVRNWDNSVTTIPPYSLISDSFRNYRPMQLSGGRRVDRAIYIDVNTVGFLTPDRLDELRRDGFIAATDKPDNSNNYDNSDNSYKNYSNYKNYLPDSSDNLRVVNLRLLRDYLENYLRNNPAVNPEMTLMVRQLDPTPSGLPVQLYFFTRTTAWVDYEHIQAEIFDHVYAVVPRFGLSIFQSPAGTDLRPLARP